MYTFLNNRLDYYFDFYEKLQLVRTGSETFFGTFKPN